MEVSAMSRTRTARVKREERQRAALRVFACLMCLLTLFALTRVSLSARVAEAAVDAEVLRQEIRAERLETDALEIDRSVLSTPERLASIASVSMQMCEPSQLSYLEIEAPAAPSDASPVSLEELPSDGGFTVRSLVAAVMDMAAGEAEVLLVGDAGLASSR
jgi:hypothetical protein